jgi:hypothetical protein
MNISNCVYRYIASPACSLRSWTPLREAAANRLKTTKFGEGLDPVDPGNPWGASIVE